jgi:tetratricopeptide (TPR) repeat protein
VMSLVELGEIRLLVAVLSVRRLCFILSLSLACAVQSDETGGPLALEEAIQLETAVGNLTRAEEIYQKLATSGPKDRTRAEAAFRLADLYSRQAKNAEAKRLFLQVLRDFPEATDLIPLAEVELTNVTALLTRDQIGSNLAATHHVGDLVIALQGALENGETDRANDLVQQLTAILKTLAPGTDAPDLFRSLKAGVEEIAAALGAERGGGVNPTRTKLSKGFEPFLQRTFPSDPHDVFAAVWRMKDRIARFLASSSNAERIRTNALDLERYLAPLVSLPSGPQAGALARLVSTGISEIRQLAEDGKFREARQRMQDLDAARHEQFPDVRLVATLPTRMPEHAVAAAWAVIFRIELAWRELDQLNPTAAMNHLSEAAVACRDVQPRVEAPEAAAWFAQQLQSLELALSELQSERIESAQQTLKHLREKQR